MNGPRRLCGYDINGWRDRAARNWIIQSGEDEDFETDTVLETGPNPAIVRSAANGTVRWIGGVQADLAPHGRGDGWGQIGAMDRRDRMDAILLRRDEDRSVLLAALMTGLADRSRVGVLSINDDAKTDDLTRECWLQAMRAAKVEIRHLVWRPVLATLAAMGTGSIEEGMRVGVICQSAKGFKIQQLRIRREDGDGIIAPERRSVGCEVASDAGFENRLAAARAILRPQLDRVTIAPEAVLANASLPAALALGMDPFAELVRLANGGWHRLETDEPLPDTAPFLSTNLPSFLSSCDLVLFETVGEGSFARTVAGALADALPVPLIHLPSDSVASGALLAARRVDARQTVFFDFLPGIDTIVSGREGAQSFPLIDPEETLPAGRLYRSPAPAQLAIIAGQSGFDIWLRKETAELPRKARIKLDNPVAQTTPIALSVEQMPAAGRARIVLESSALPSQESIDFDQAEPVDRPWQTIIDSLQHPPPSIPERMVLPCGEEAWAGDGYRSGLGKLLLETSLVPSSKEWDSLSGRLVQRSQGRYCLSSDGDAPAGVTEADIRRLDRISAVAMGEIEAMLRGRRPLDTAPLKFLTWQFRRCPQDLVPHLIEAIKNEETPLVSASPHWILIWQGLGRSVREREDEREVLRLAMRKAIPDWNWRRETACVAFLLSRSDTAPKHLERPDVERLAKRVRGEFRAEFGKQYTRFNYAPLLLAGLLRWRLKEPYALIAGQDPVATKLKSSVDTAIDDISRRSEEIKSSKKILKLLRDIGDELEGTGTNPDLLADLFTI
ncbi:hypothetical protein N7I30_08680 [Aurantimonas litoralis]|nr:hypothetical protein [Aurantimonas litoralis]